MSLISLMVMSVQLASFEIRDPATAKKLSTGVEHIEMRDGVMSMRTEYRDAADRPAQTEESQLDGQSLRLSTYTFSDPISGETASLTVSGAKAKATYRSDKNDGEDSTTFGWHETSISGKAIPSLVQRNWDVLAKGEHVKFDLYVPQRLETIGFRAVRLPAPGQSRVVIRVEASNWLIRQLAPALDFTYDTSGAEPRIVQFDGPSPVTIDGVKNRQVRMVFSPATSAH